MISNATSQQHITSSAPMKTDACNYVMYGFCKSDKDNVGYLARIPTHADDEFLTDDIHLAKRFPSKNLKNQSGFGTPKQWLDFINAELEDLQGENAFKFHLVKTAL